MPCTKKQISVNFETNSQHFVFQSPYHVVHDSQGFQQPCVSLIRSSRPRYFRGKYPLSLLQLGVMIKEGPLCGANSFQNYFALQSSLQPPFPLMLSIFTVPMNTCDVTSSYHQEAIVTGVIWWYM